MAAYAAGAGARDANLRTQAGVPEGERCHALHVRAADCDRVSEKNCSNIGSGRERTIVCWPPDDAFASPTAAIPLSCSERVKPTQIS